MKDEILSKRDNDNKPQEFKDKKCNESSRDKKEHESLNVINYNINANAEKKNKCSKTSKDHEKKYKCCCDTNKLRKILLAYKENGVLSLFIVTTNRFLNQSLLGDVFNLLFIKDVNKNTVYLSVGSANEPVKYIIPLNIIIFVTASRDNQQPELIDDIVNKKTEKEEKCCFSAGIAKAISEAVNYVESLVIYVADIGTVELQSNGALFLPDIVLFSVLDLNITAISNDIILISSDPLITPIIEFIIPTCWISGLTNIAPALNVENILLDSNVNPNISKKESLIGIDSKGKIVDIRDIEENIEGKTLEEIKEMLN